MDLANENPELAEMAEELFSNIINICTDETYIQLQTWIIYFYVH